MRVQYGADRFGLKGIYLRNQGVFLVAVTRFFADIAETLQTVKGINGRGSGKPAKYASANQRLPEALWEVGQASNGLLFSIFRAPSWFQNSL